MLQSKTGSGNGTNTFNFSQPTWPHWRMSTESKKGGGGEPSGRESVGRGRVGRTVDTTFIRDTGSFCEKR